MSRSEVTAMHAEAYEWVAPYATAEPVKVLDIGGRNINGTVRTLFPCADFTALDILPGEGVDIVADAATWTPDRAYDVVTCAEVFEHTDVWPQIVVTAHAALGPGGVFVATMAGPGRVPHSAFDGGPLQAGEYYDNVSPDDLERELKAAGFVDIVVDQHGPDVRCAAARP
jgi:hypothetical protein